MPLTGVGQFADNPQYSAAGHAFEPGIGNDIGERSEFNNLEIYGNYV